MIETRLKCDYQYARSLLPLDLEDDFKAVWERILLVGQHFNPLYLQNMPIILSRIPIYTGYEWDEFSPNVIDIYLAEFRGPSRTNPITLKIQDLNKMLLVLIHELTHVNMPNKSVPVNVSLYEDIVNQVTIHTAHDLNFDYSITNIQKYREDIKDEGYLPIDVPLYSLTVRKFFHGSKSLPLTLC